MNKILLYSIIAVITTTSEILLIFLFQKLQGKQYKLTKFTFSIRNYYLMISPLIISFLIALLLIGSLNLIIIFCVFALTGIVGETLFSIWWKVSFPKKYFVYNVHTLFNAYSSLLNLIPWGIGGFLSLSVIRITNYNFTKPVITNQFSTAIPFYTFFWIIFLSIIPLSIILLFIYRRGKKYDPDIKNINFITYILFSLPMILSIVGTAIFYSPNYFFVSIYFGIMYFITEYLFGKISVIFISKKLWYYNYNSVDNNHTTFLNIIPFMAGGFLFWSAALILHLI